MAKSDYAVKQSLTKEGYEVYNEALNKLQNGSDKSKLAANENAFIYARMAESWAKIRNEYGDTAYTAKNFMAEHAVNIGKKQQSNEVKIAFNQEEIQVTEEQQELLEKGKEYILKAINGERLENMVLWEVPKQIQKKIQKEARLQLNGYKFELVADDIRHAKNSHGRKEKDGEIKLDNASIQHALDILASPDNIVVGNISANGLPSIRFEKKENDGTMSVVENILMSKKRLRLKTIWKDANAVVNAQKDPGHTSEYNGKNTSFHDNSLTKTVNKNNTSKQTFDQRAWHGSGMDFNEFNLEKALTGAGDMVHGWSIYTTKNKKTARAYKKHAKSKGLPSYQYEVDIPFIDVRPCV